MTATLAPDNDTAALAMAMASTALDAQKRAEAAELRLAERERELRQANAELSIVSTELNEMHGRVTRLVDALQSDRNRKLARQTVLDAVRGLL